MTREEALERYDRIRYNLLNAEDKAAVDIAFDALARNLHDVASNQQVTEPLHHNSLDSFGASLATENQVTSDKASDKTNEQSAKCSEAITKWISVKDGLPEPPKEEE